MERVEKVWEKEKMLVTSIFSFSHKVLNMRTMMVLYRSPEYKAVQIKNEDK